MHNLERQRVAVRFVNLLESLKTGSAAVRDDRSRGEIHDTATLTKMSVDRDSRPTGSHNEYFSPASGEVIFRYEGVEGEAGGVWIFSARLKLPVMLSQTADLAHQFGQRVGGVEEVSSCMIEVKLVCGHEGAQAQRVILEELDHNTVVLRRGVHSKVYTDHLDITQAKFLGPGRKHSTD